jgi:hypothetical protein
MDKRKLFPAALGAFFIGFFWAFPARAVCPVCTVAVGAGVGLARWLGVDDTITGTWIGGLMMSLTLWTVSWFEKKQIRFKGRTLAAALLYYGLVVVPLVWLDVVGHPLNRLWGADKLLLGVIAGSFVFLAANRLYELLKRRNGSQAHFPFEKIVFPIVALMLASGIFYFIVK